MRGFSAAIITLVCLATFIAAFAATWGPVVWVMIPEVLPLSVRGTVFREAGRRAIELHGAKARLVGVDAAGSAVSVLQALEGSEATVDGGNFERTGGPALYGSGSRLIVRGVRISRAEYGVPIRYPVACHPQAWAAGSIPFFLQVLFGLEADGFAPRLQVNRPILPDRADMFAGLRTCAV